MSAAATLSRSHLRVQTRTPEGRWVTREWSEHYLRALMAAERYADELQVPARVVLDEVVYYATQPVVGASLGAWGGRPAGSQARPASVRTDRPSPLPDEAV